MSHLIAAAERALQGCGPRRGQGGQDQQDQGRELQLYQPQVGSECDMQATTRSKQGGHLGPTRHRAGGGRARQCCRIHDGRQVRTKALRSPGAQAASGVWRLMRFHASCAPWCRCTFLNVPLERYANLTAERGACGRGLRSECCALVLHLYRSPWDLSPQAARWLCECWGRRPWRGWSRRCKRRCAGPLSTLLSLMWVARAVPQSLTASASRAACARAGPRTWSPCTRAAARCRAGCEPWGQRGGRGGGRGGGGWRGGGRGRG